MIYVTQGAFSNMIVNRFNGIVADCAMELPNNYFSNGKLDIPDSTELVVFSGGADVNPALYGETNNGSFFDAERDVKESLVFHTALTKGIPIFGICRGLQLINVLFGGTLHQEIFGIQTSPHSGGHDLHYSKTCSFMDGYSKVNSMHHQGIKKLGDGLEIYAEYGGIPEIIIHNRFNVKAVQFHPECMSTSHVFRVLIEDTFRRRRLS